MIGYLVGKPKVQGNKLLVLVNGVGYLVSVGQHTLNQVLLQDECELFIYTHVREESLELYGFKQLSEKEMFEMLLSVSGVGPRIALAITEYGAQAIIDAVQTANVGLFSSVTRVGKKLAQKIIIELKPKLGSLYELQLGPQTQQHQDVVEALSALGFNESEIHIALQKIPQAENSDTSSLVKSAIKILGQHH